MPQWTVRRRRRPIELGRLDVVHAGPHRYATARHPQALSAAQLATELRSLRLI